MNLNTLLIKSNSSTKNIFPDLSLWINFPAFTGWCALSCGIAAGYKFVSPAMVPSILYNETGIVAMVLLAFVALVSSSKLLRIVCFVTLGLCLYAYGLADQQHEFNQWKKTLSAQKKCRLSGRIISAPCLINGRYSFFVKSDSVFSFKGPGALKNKTIVCFSFKEPPPYGSVVLTGRFSLPHPNLNPGGFDAYLYYMSNNLWGTFFGDSIVQERPNSSFLSQAAGFARTTVRTSLSKIDNEEYRGILQAAFLNDQSDLTTSMKNLFFKAGIYHLLALSGFNIAILAGALMAFLFIVPIKKEWKIIISLAAIWLYLFFIGFIPSLFRAVIMATVVSAAYLVQRKSHMLNSLGVAGIVWLCMSPLSLFTPSYQLSFAATFGLITLSPVFLNLFKLPVRNNLLRKILTAVVSIASVSLASFIATLPILMYQFNQFYIYGLFANLFSVTLMSLAMWAALAGFMIQIIFPPLAIPCMHCAELLIDLMVKGAGLVEYIPWTALQVSLPYLELYVLFAIFVLGFILVKKDFYSRYFRISLPVVVACTCLCFLFHRAHTTAQIVSFKAKNTHLTGIRWPNNHIWLIGNGPETTSFSTYQRTILPWMHQAGPHKLEIVIFPNYPENAVHFLEPLLSNDHVRQVKCCDSSYDKDEDFLSFLKNYKSSISYLHNGDIMFPAPQCTCQALRPKEETVQKHVDFRIRIYNTVIFLPDSSKQPDDSLGAEIITINKFKMPRFERGLTEMHPLFTSQRNNTSAHI
jgi:ComEC/Rec2-related protein